MKKLLLYLLAILTPFIFISSSNAASIGIPEQFKTPAQVLYSNCSSPTSCTIGMSVSEYTYQNHGFYYNSSAVTLGNSGVYINFLPDVMPQSNYVYSVSTFLCFDSSNLGSGIYPNVTTYAGYNDRKFSPNNYHYTAPASVDLNSITIADWGSGEIPDKCIQYTSVIVPSEKSNWLGIHITNSSSSNGTRIYFMGYYAESLGVMGEYVADDVASQVGTIVKNSGLATATSVDEVNESIETMKEEITSAQQETNNKLDQTNEALGDINDSLTNSDAPDGMDSLGSASGWLPPGPVDSLLTLPLSMLNNISTSLGSTCKPINLPIPFVNQNLTMPCLNTIYSQISGLGVFLNSIGTIAAGFMLYYYFKKLYAYIDNLLSLKNNGEGWGDV